MESFIIEGGHPLKGTITPQGAKNEALEVICTTILTRRACAHHQRAGHPGCEQPD